MELKAQEENNLKDQLGEIQQMQKQLMHAILENERDTLAKEELANMRPQIMVLGQNGMLFLFVRFLI